MPARTTFRTVYHGPGRFRNRSGKPVVLPVDQDGIDRICDFGDLPRAIVAFFWGLLDHEMLSPLQFIGACVICLVSGCRGRNKKGHPMRQRFVLLKSVSETPSFILTSVVVRSISKPRFNTMLVKFNSLHVAVIAESNHLCHFLSAHRHGSTLRYFRSGFDDRNTISSYRL